MKRGFALVIALAFFVLAGTLTTVLLAFGSNAGVEARTGLELQAARRAAEAAIRMAEEKAGQDASRSYFSDPIEAYFWFGGDLPSGGVNARPDGLISNDGEVIGFDHGIDNVPDLLEPRFAINGTDLFASGVAFTQDMDPAGDDLVPGDNFGPAATVGLATERNGRLDQANLVGNSPQLVVKAYGLGLTSRGVDGLLGPDLLPSVLEAREDSLGSPGSYVTRIYHPVGNPDPGGDDFHPVFNPLGLEGRLQIQGTSPAASIVPTVENSETRWRRYIHKVGPQAEMNDGSLDGYCSVRAIDTSAKVDVNGPSFLTARLIHGLLQTVGTSPGPITTENPSLGYNGRGIEASRPVANWPALSYPNAAAAALPVQLLGGNLNLLDWPQFPLLPNPAFHDFSADLATALPPPVVGDVTVTPPSFSGPPFTFGPNIYYTPRKIASSKAEEDLYFSQPVSDVDPDAVAIVKYRNRALGGRFTSVTQLLEVRRADGTPVFPDRDRDELLRLATFLTIEAWRDSQTVAHRNGDFLMRFVDTNADTLEDTFEWDPFAITYVDPEPWQDLRVNGIFEGGERFEDFGFDQVPSAETLPTLFDDESDAVYNRTHQAGALPGPGIFLNTYHPFLNPDPGLDDFHTIWNPFFARNFAFTNSKRIFVPTTRFGTKAWSPLMDTYHLGGASLRHIHYSDLNSIPFAGLPQLTFVHPQVLFNDSPYFFNYDALEGNGFLDLDPYQADPNPLPARLLLPGGFPAPPGIRPEPGPQSTPLFPGTGSYPYGPQTVVGVMWSEHWNPLGFYLPSPPPDPALPGPSYPRPLPNFDFGLDQLNSLYFPGSPLMDPQYKPLLVAGGPQDPTTVLPRRDEFYYNLSNLTAIDPNADNADFDDNFLYPPNVPTFNLLNVDNAGLFSMSNHQGKEGNLRFDPYPEIGRWAFGAAAVPGNRYDLPFPDNYYQNAQVISFGTPTNLFLTPAFFPLPPAFMDIDANPATVDILRPPRWALPDKDWMVEPGEWYSDWGRDRLPFTGDFGEGNGMWDPGESFNDVGLDNRGNFDEQAFGNVGATLPLSNDNQVAISTTGTGVGIVPDDFSSDDLRSQSGAQRGTEFSNLFDLIREPFLDLNRNGLWDRGSTIAEGNGAVPAFGGASLISQPRGAFRDRNGDRIYDRGIFREQRAPVNLNAAPEEVLAAVLYQSLIYPAKKRRDRFCVIAEDFPSAPGAVTSARDDYDWSTTIYDKDPSGRYFRADLRFAQCLSRGLARAIWLRRMGLYNSVNPAIGSGAFRSWPEFESFVAAILQDPLETARFVSGGIHAPNARDAFGLQLVDPFGLPNASAYPNLADGIQDLYPNVAPGLSGKARRLAVERILIQSNPNTRLRGSADYSYLNGTRFDKTDFPFPSAEFCFGATGVFEMTAIGYAVAGASIAGSLPPLAQIVGAGYGLASEDLLSSYDIRASLELQKTIRVFSHLRQSSLSDFEASKPLQRGVAMLPSLAENKEPTSESHIGLVSNGVMNEVPRPSNSQLQAPFGPFLCLRPDITVVDNVRNLTIVASSLPFDGTIDYSAWRSQPGEPDSGGRIQVFDYLPNVNPNFSAEPVKNFPSNNGVQFYVVGTPSTPIYTTTPTLFYRFGMIEPGNGMAAAGAVPEPTIRAMAFDPLFPRPKSFPNLDPNLFGGTCFALSAAAAPGGVYLGPGNVNYFGRLYFLDDRNQRLRAIDLGRDESGGLISQEVFFAGFDIPDFSSVAYGPGQTGLKIELVPERREIFVFTGDTATGVVFARRLRYAEGIEYPGVDSQGNQALQPVLGEAPLAIAGLSILDLEAGSGIPAPLGLPVFVSKDDKTGYLYVGGSTVFGSTAGTERDVLIYRLDPEVALGAPNSLVQVFPWGLGSGSPTAPHFMPPGFRSVCKLDTVPIGSGFRRELVGMEIDAGKGLLFALWNWEHPLLSPPGVGVERFEQNGPGAYLAAIPLGAAPYLSTPLANPFPMLLTQRHQLGFNLNQPYCAPLGVLEVRVFQPQDAQPIFASSMALDHVQEVMMIAPREQLCVGIGTFSPPGTCSIPAIIDPNTVNPWARDKNRLTYVAYNGDGLQVREALSEFTLRTDDPLTNDPAHPLGPTSSWNNTHPLYLGASAGGFTYSPSFGRPRPVHIEAYPGRGLFFLSIPAAFTDILQPTPFFGLPAQCSVPAYGSFYNGVDTPNVPWLETRSIRLLEVRGFNFGLGNTPVDHWVDGRLSVKADSVPLSAFLEANVEGSVAGTPQQGKTMEGWLHSRADMDASAFFAAPEYLADQFDPVIPVSSRALFCQTNARVKGEGVVVDGALAIVPKNLDANPATNEWSDQRVYYPQDGIIRNFNMAGPRPNLPTGAPSTANAVNSVSGWSALDTGGEFWVRFGDLQDFLPIAGGFVNDEIVILEKHTKVKAELQQPDSSQPTGLNFLNNPFLNHDPSVAVTPAIMQTRLFNILKANQDLGGAAPAAITRIDYFFPDAIDVWAYDRISITNVSVGPPLTADFVYERRLAGPAGQYPGIFRPRVAGDMYAWGTLPALPQAAGWTFPPPANVSALGTDLNFLPGPTTFQHPFAPSVFANANLGDNIEEQKYAVVVVNNQSAAYRFAPIWSNSRVPAGATLNADRQAAYRVVVPSVQLDQDGWVRVAYASLVDFNPDDTTRALMMPGSGVSRTRLLVWNDAQSLAPSVALSNTIGVGAPGSKLGPDRLGWYQFPGDREGFLAAGAYSVSAANGLLPAGYPANTPTAGGPLITNAGRIALPYLIDDIAIYNSPLPLLALANGHAQRRTILRFPIGEAGWPTGLHGGESYLQPGGPSYLDGSTGAFPNLLPLSNATTADLVGSPYFPEEPFFDFNGDGVRNRVSAVNPPMAVSIWDANGNGRWDFGELNALPGDVDPDLGALPGLIVGGIFDQPPLGIYGEPFHDLNRNGFWDGLGDGLIDLNFNGVMDGEPFVDSNGNWIYDPGLDPIPNALNDYNKNGVWDGGEPYIDYPPNGAYQPRFSEPFVNRDTGAPLPDFDPGPGVNQEFYFDENRNGRWDLGEPFTSWSRETNPQGGELYRENILKNGFEDDGLFVGASGVVPSNLNSPAPSGGTGVFEGFPYRGKPGNTWISDPQTPDWNNDGRYEGAGLFEGEITHPIPAGSRIGAVSFTQWQPMLAAGAVDRRGHISLDIDLRAADGRFLGRWTGVDNLSLDAGNELRFADESGIGFPVSVDTRLRYRVNFFMPNPRLDTTGSTRSTASPIFDDLSFTVILPQQHQIVFENRVTTPLLVPEFARGLIQ